MSLERKTVKMYRKDGLKTECGCSRYDSSSSYASSLDESKYSHLDGYDIYVVRGDSLDISLPLSRNNSAYELGVGDILHSQCRAVGNCSYIVWDKVISSSDQVLHILPSDTENIDPELTYVWDAQIEYSDGRVETVTPTPSNLQLISDVTERLPEVTGGG